MHGKVVLAIKGLIGSESLAIGGYRCKGAVTDQFHGPDAYFEAIRMQEERKSREYGHASIYALPPEALFSRLISQDALEEYIVMDDSLKKKEPYVVLFVFTQEKFSHADYLPQGIYEAIISVVEADSERNALGRAKETEEINQELRMKSHIRTYIIRADDLERYRLPVDEETLYRKEDIL